MSLLVECQTVHIVYGDFLCVLFHDLVPCKSLQMPRNDYKKAQTEPLKMSGNLIHEKEEEREKGCV